MHPRIIALIPAFVYQVRGETIMGDGDGRNA